MDRNLRIRMLLEAGDRFSRPLRDLTTGAGRAGQALASTQQRLKGLERAQSDIAGFRELKTGLRSTQGELQAARQRVTDLGRAMGQAANPTRAMTRDFARARTEAQRLERQHQAETRQLNELRERLGAAGISTRDLARHERELRQQMAGANREIEEQSRRMQQLADRERRMNAGRQRFQRMQGAATGMAASGAAAIGTGMIMAAPQIAAVKKAQEFESVMTDIGQKADLSRQASAQLGRQLLIAARAANQMPADLQAGVDTLAGLGAKVPDAVAMMTPIGRASTAYKAEIADLSAAAFAAKDSLKVPVAETGKVIDIMATAGKAGAFEIKDMAQYFPALSAAYQGLGQTGTDAVADLAAGLQIVRKGAGDSATAGTNLSNILQKIASPATNKAFEKMGVNLPEALKKAYKEGKTPLEAIAELTNKTLKGDLSKLGYLFEDAQVQQGLRPLIQNMEEYRRIRAEAAGASGTTDRDFAERMKDSAEQTKKLTVNGSVLAITLASQLLPTVNAVTEKAVAFATWIGDVAQRHPEATKAVMVGAAAFAGLFFVLGGGAIVIAGLIAPFSALAFASGALGIGMLPVVGIALAVVAGVVAIGAAAYLIYKNWGPITAWFAGAWQTMKDSARSALDWFLTLPQRFSSIGVNIVAGLIGGITGQAGAVAMAIMRLAGIAMDTFKKKLGIHSPSRVFMSFGGYMMEGLDQGIAAGAKGPVRRIGDVSGRLTDALDGTPGSPLRIEQSSGVLTKALAIGATLGIGTVPAMAAPAPFPASAARAPISVTVHVNSVPGQSPQDLGDAIARAVSDALDRRDQVADRAARSSLADTPDYGY
ncbi:phage tail tape measure protein [Sphingomonas abaci]|uniref:TP901 family phage tail tape measure protein n=1 Tax=Sphingomonas abaci TaxID=237611 RepID=A0A7W7AJH8_9SPHN|nr:phage tail tape measure protein [Sphingomonas abaci]MBB4617996.1 TP901 family phage tail tape measure protein [Sphingomonas abaci]